MWGAILYCPASSVGLTPEQIEAAERQTVLDPRVARRRMSLNDSPSPTQGKVLRGWECGGRQASGIRVPRRFRTGNDADEHFCLDLYFQGDLARSG